MKNKKLFIFLIFTVFILTGCQNGTDEIKDIDFNMEFIDLNKETKNAVFQVTGYPNEEEFKQIPQVITDSMKNQKVDGKYEISVYSKKENTTKDKLPFYGKVEYENGKIINNKLTAQTPEAYLEEFDAK